MDADPFPYMFRFVEQLVWRGLLLAFYTLLFSLHNRNEPASWDKPFLSLYQDFSCCMCIRKKGWWVYHIFHLWLLYDCFFCHQHIYYKKMLHSLNNSCKSCYLGYNEIVTPGKKETKHFLGNWCFISLSFYHGWLWLVVSASGWSINLPDTLFYWPQATITLFMSHSVSQSIIERTNQVYLVINLNIFFYIYSPAHHDCEQNFLDVVLKTPAH